MSTIKGIRFDAPLYQRDQEHGSAFLNCQAVYAAFTITGDIKRLLPKELVQAADPPMGVVSIAAMASAMSDHIWSTILESRSRTLPAKQAIYSYYIYIYIYIRNDE